MDAAAGSTEGVAGIDGADTAEATRRDGQGGGGLDHRGPVHKRHRGAAEEGPGEPRGAGTPAGHQGERTVEEIQGLGFQARQGEGRGRGIPGSNCRGAGGTACDEACFTATQCDEFVKPSLGVGRTVATAGLSCWVAPATQHSSSHFSHGG